MTTNVIPMPEPLEKIGQRIDAAYARAQHGREEWIEGSLELAQALADARARFPSNNEFGAWCGANGHDHVNHQDRAVLIKMATNSSLARIIFEETERRSYQLIWQHEMQDRFTSASKTELKSTSLPETPPVSAPAAKSDDPPKLPIPNDRSILQSPIHALELIAAIRANPNANQRDAAAALGVSLGVYQRTRRELIGDGEPPVKQRSGIYNAPRAAEVAAIFQHEKARTMLGHMLKQRGGKQIWDMLLEALDAGLLVVNELALKQPTLTLLFPAAAPRGYTSRVNLLNQDERGRVREIILPAMIACREQLLAEPDRIREILTEHLNAQRARQREVVHHEKRAVAVKTLPPAEQELAMFGQTVWPRLDNSQGEYDYDQVRAAIWTFRDYETWNVLAQENTKSHAMRIRNSLRYLGEYLDRTDRNNRMRTIISLMMWFSYLMEKNPTAECKWPMYPHIEGQW